MRARISPAVCALARAPRNAKSTAICIVFDLPYRSDQRRTSSRFTEISIVENLGDRPHRPVARRFGNDADKRSASARLRRFGSIKRNFPAYFVISPKPERLPKCVALPSRQARPGPVWRTALPRPAFAARRPLSGPLSASERSILFARDRARR
jgi:hypothetical protein